MSSVQPAAPLAQSAPEPEREGIVTKLTQLVKITENAVPAPSSAVQQIAQIAHTLVAEITTHLREQDKRIAELEHLATTDPLTRVMNRRGFLSSLLGAACLAATRHFAPVACSIATKPEVVVLTLAEVAREHDVDLDETIKILEMRSPLLDDVVWVDGDIPAPNYSVTRTALPSANWRQL